MFLLVLFFFTMQSHSNGKEINFDLLICDIKVCEGQPVLIQPFFFYLSHVVHTYAIRGDPVSPKVQSRSIFSRTSGADWKGTGAGVVE